MTKFHVSKFDGQSTSTLGYSINKQFTPDLDIRTVEFWDATRADLQTVVTGTGGIPKLTALKGVLGKTLTSVSTGSAPASQDASGNKGIVWRSDSASEGNQRLILPAGLLQNAKEVLIGIVLSQQVQTPTSRLFEMSSDGTLQNVTVTSQFAVFGAPNNYTLTTQKLSVSSLNLPNFPTDNTLHCILFHYKKNGTVAVRLDGIEIATQTASALKALLPLGGSGVLGADYAGNLGISRDSGTRITHIAIAEVQPIPSASDGLTSDKVRDRNAAEYWEASLMYAAGIESKLPNGHTFKSTTPITTWLGERT